METASVKRFLKQDEVWLYLRGWLSPDEKGEQKPYTEKVAVDALKEIIVVTMVKRRASFYG